MAGAIWKAYTLLLVFGVGCFLAWIITLHSQQRFWYAPQKSIYADDGNINGRKNGSSVSDASLRNMAGNRSRPGNDSTPAHNGTFRGLLKPAPFPGADPTVKALRKSSSLCTDYEKASDDRDDVNITTKPRVLCWILTSPTRLYSRAIGIRDTWGPRCDVTLYMSSQTDEKFPAVGLDVREGRNALWNKTKAALRYIYEHHFDDADWFMKADDDTYVIVENLRHLLRDKNESEPVYFGHHFKPYVKQGYMSGGAGYVMSKEALRRLVTKQLSVGSGDCGVVRDWRLGIEDVMLGTCLAAVGVKTGDSRDGQNRARFIPISLKTFVSHTFPKWYHRFAKYEVKPGLECCSDRLISLHYIPNRTTMLITDYYIHGIKLHS